MRAIRNISKVPIRNSNDLGIFVGIIGSVVFLLVWFYGL